MPMHLFMDMGPVESSEMRTKNFMRAVIQILRGRLTGARFKLPDGHWAYAFWVNSSAEDTYDKIEAMVPSEPHYLSPLHNAVRNN